MRPNTANCRNASSTSLLTNFRTPTSRSSKLLHLLSGERRNIVVVGDNDQAIYRFRGASFGSFKLFLQRFANWKKAKTQTAVSRGLDGKLSLHAEYPARGHASHRDERGQPRIS